MIGLRRAYALVGAASGLHAAHAYANSEPETKLLHAIASAFRPLVYVDVHSGDQTMMYPYSYKAEECPDGSNPASSKYFAVVDALLTSQRELVDAVIRAVERKEPLRAFVDAPGGTGKTYCFNTILRRGLRLGCVE